MAHLTMTGYSYQLVHHRQLGKLAASYPIINTYSLLNLISQFVMSLGLDLTISDSDKGHQ